MKNFFVRAITGVLFVAVLVGAILFAPLSFSLLFTLIAALTVHEFATLANGTVYYTTTERFSDTPAGKYGVVVITIVNSTRKSAMLMCTDGTMYINSWNPSTSAVTGWIEK